MRAQQADAPTNLGHSVSHLPLDILASALYIGHSAPHEAAGKMMQHILFSNLTARDTTIFAVCFVASIQVLRNDEMNPGCNLNYFSDGSFEWSKVTIV